MERVQTHNANSVRRVSVLSVCIFAAVMFFPHLQWNVQGQAPSPWSGTWKLDITRSRRPGSNFSIKLGRTGEYEMTTATFIDRFRCDRQEYPLSGSGLTISCNEPLPHVMDTVLRKNGKITARVHRELSTNDTIMTSIATVAGSAPKTTKMIYRRMSGTTGFVGAWSDEHLLEDEPQIMVTDLRGRRLRISFPGKKTLEDISLDGSDSRVQGLASDVNVTLAGQLSGPLTISMKKKVDGRLLEKGTITLSPNGQTLMSTFWEVAYPNMKTLFVYHRQ